MSPAEAAIVRERRIKFAFFFASLILLFLFVTQIDNMLISLILSVTIYYLLLPAVDALERRGLPRVWATAIPFVTLIVFTVGGAILFAPAVWNQIQSLQENVGHYSDAVHQFVERLESDFSPLQDRFDLSLSQNLQPIFMEWSTQLLRNLPDWISHSFTVIFLVPFFSFFLLLDGRDLIRKWLSLVPNNIFELALNLNHQIGSQIGGFIRARLIQTLFVGLFVWIGLAIIGFPFALVLGLIAGILNIIPYVGPVIAAVPALVIALSNQMDSSQIFLVLAVYIAGQVLDTIILVPFLVARIVNLHPVLVIISVVVGAQLMGILGMVICIPVVAALKVTGAAIYRHFTDFRT